MGEYAIRKSDNTHIKVGTCDSVYYLRLEDAHRVKCLPGSVDPATESGLRFRLPFPDEDDVLPGEYEDYNRGVRLYQMVPDHRGHEWANDYAPGWLIADAKPGVIQLHHESGLLINVPCHHGTKLPDLGPKTTVFWNGKTHSLELSSVKRLADGSVVPVVRCRHCGEAWRTTWDDVLPFIADEELRQRLEKYNVKQEAA